MTPGLESYLGLIYAFYGLAFFSLGMVAFMLPRHVDGLPIAPHLGWLAAFGMAHGLMEFVEGQRLVASAPWLDWAGGALLVGSYGALLEFGRRIWNAGGGPFALPAAPIHAAVAAAVAVVTLGATEPWAGLDLATRWLVGMPAALLSGLGLLRLAGSRAWREGVGTTLPWLRLAAMALLAYGVLTPFPTPTGMVPWLPTTEDFLAVTGLPIQLARALCAVLVAVAFVMLLRRSSHRADTALRRVVNTLDGFVYRCRNDRHWRMVSVTDGVLALTGYAPEAFLPPAEVHYGQLIHPDDVDGVWAEVQAASVARRDFHLTYRMVTRGGEVRWVRERGRGIHGADGRLECLEGHIIDDTVRHEAMEELTRTTRALRDSEARLNEAQRMARVGNWELDLASGRLAWSEEIFRIFELDPGRFDASYQAFLDAIHPDDRERVDAAYSRSLEDRSPYVISHRLCMPDGRVKWVEERCVTDFDADGRPRVSRGTVQDITERHDIEEELRQFRATLDHTLDCVFMVEPATLRFTYVNRGAMDQLGYGRDELLRMHPMDINPDFDEARLRALVAPLETGSREHLTFETRHRHCDGHLIPVEVSVQYIHKPDYAPCLIAVVRDITGRRRAEEALIDMNQALERRVAERTAALAEREAELRRAHAIARLGHWTADVQSGEVTWSEQAYRIFGQDPGTFRPSVEAFYATVHPDDLEAVQEAAAATFAGTGDFRIDHRIVRPDGELRWVHEEAVAELDGQGRPRLLSGTSQDITERKQAENAVIQARDEAERANAAKSEFLSRMSHELRTPLNAVLGFAQLLQTDPDQPLSALQADNVAEIVRAGNHLLEMVNEVLDLARIESGRLELCLEPVEMAAVVNACAASIRPMAAERGITLTLAVDPGHTVQADYTRLTQVLLNLLSNAVKYNREGGSIDLRFSVTSPARLRVAVADSGPGIAAEQTVRLFRPFERLDSATSGGEGTGIGLALSKRLVEAMGGTIGVDSVPGEGSVFWFELSLVDGSPMAAAGGGTETGATPGCRVLYVEDNAANLKLVQKIMAGRGDVELLAATRAEEGLEIARRERPTLVLLDINLPGMGGFEALKHLRGDVLTRDIPVVAVSSNAMPGDIRRAAAAGFDDYITKPLEMGHLNALIDRYVGPPQALPGGA